MKKCSRLYKDAETRGWNSRVTRDWQVAKVGTRVKHAGELKSHASCCTTGQESQAGQAIYSRLELATQPSREVKLPEHLVWQNMTFHIPSYPTIYMPLYPRFKESF